MKSTSSLHLSIIHDPLAWIHTSRFAIPERFQNTCCTSLINEMLLDNFNLCREITHITPGSVAELFIHYWNKLPHIAFLMACQRHRAQLACQGNIIKLPESVQQFTQFPLIKGNPANWKKTFTIFNFFSCSVRELLPFAGQLPPTLSERLPLLFPQISQTELEEDTMSVSADLFIFKLAIQHVKAFPYTLTSLCP